MEFSLTTRDLLQRIWNWIPGKNAWEKLSLVFAVLGVVVAVPPAFDWVQQKWSGTPSVDKQIKELKDLVNQRLQAQAAAQGDSNKPSDQLKSGIEKDIGAAIETLAEGGKKEALAALERGDTKAAEAVLAEKIDQLDKARTGSAQKEAALYRQRGALAYLNDTQAALRDYAKAAELDPDDGEGLYFLGQLQERAGELPAAKRNVERLIALGDRVGDERLRHWAYFVLGDVEATLGDRNAALDHYKRGQALVQALIKRDPENAEWQRDLSVSYERVGDISVARGDRDGTLKAYQDDLDIAKQLAARDPNNAEWQRDLSVSYGMIAIIHQDRGELDQALEGFRKTLEIQQGLAARDPNNAEWQRDLSVSYDRVGDMQRQSAGQAGMLQSFQNALEICKKLTKKDPANALWQTDLAWSHFMFVRAAADGWRRHAQDGLAILKRLDAEGKLTADQKGWIGAFEEALREPENRGPRR